MTKSYLVIIYLFLFAGIGIGQTILSPSIDTYTQSSKADDSFTSEDLLRIKRTPAGTNDRETWIQFDISGQPTQEQILLRLVKLSGNEGNVSVVGTDEITNSITWNNASSTSTPFHVGGYRIGDTTYFDVTEYVNQQIDLNEAAVNFKLFTTSNITSTITFASNEHATLDIRPKLEIHGTKEYDIPLFGVHEPVTIPTENGSFQGNLLGDHTVAPDERNTYGGWSKGSSNATGFFRTEKDCEGTWHIIDPQGNLFYSAGLNTVFEGGGVNLPTELIDLGLNTMGSWSDEDIEDLAYCPRFNVIVNFKNSDPGIKTVYEDLEILPVFETTFASFCTTLAQNELPQYANDQWVLGYFLDNELLFHRDQLTLSLTLLNSTNAQYQEADAWMTSQYGNSYTLNDITDEDRAAYQGHVAETYFNTIATAFRAVDNNHLLIGTRFHAGVKYIPEIFAAAGNQLDILSINYYNRFEPEEEIMEMWLEEANIPFMITEFYTKGADSGLGNSDGAGWEVPTQQDRADWFENWMLKLLQNKGNVGFHWFRYRDKDGQDSNKGLFDVNYEAYPELALSMAKVSQSIYSLRSHVLYGNGNYNGVINCLGELCGPQVNCDIITDLHSHPQNSEYPVSFFPNPVSNQLTIQSENSELIQVEIIDIEGLVVKQAQATGFKSIIELQQLAAGLYLIKVTSNKATNTFQFLKD